MTTPNIDEMKKYAENIIHYLDGLTPANGRRVLDYVKSRLDDYSIIDSNTADETEEIDSP